MSDDDEFTPIPFNQLPLADRLAKAHSWDRPMKQAVNFIIVGVIGIVIGVIFAIVGFAKPGHHDPLTSLETYPLLDPLPLQGVGLIIFICSIVLICVAIFFRRFRKSMLYLVEDPDYYIRNPGQVARPLLISKRGPEYTTERQRGFLEREAPPAERTPGNSFTEKPPMEEIELAGDDGAPGRRI